jgi:hypothetical protein
MAGCVPPSTSPPKTAAEDKLTAEVRAGRLTGGPGPSVVRPSCLVERLAAAHERSLGLVSQPRAGEFVGEREPVAAAA